MSKSDKRTIADIKKEIVKITDRISKDRDELRDLIGELEEIEASCDEAIEDLVRAADSLSEYL